MTNENLYEKLVREYLEERGWLARSRVKFWQKRNGKKKGGWSDLDIIATKNGKVIVGQVKAESQNKEDIEQINKDFESARLKAKVVEIAGTREFQKWVYCYSVDNEMRKYAKDNFNIEMCSFGEVLIWVFDEVRNKTYAGKGKSWLSPIFDSDLMILCMLIEDKKKEIWNNKTPIQ